MKKQQFNWKGYYVSPSCEMFATRTTSCMQMTDQWTEGGGGFYDETTTIDNGSY